MTEVNQWSYFCYVAKVPDVKHFDDVLNALGDEGWELSTSVSTIKTKINLTGNDLVLIFKKAGSGHRPGVAVSTAINGGESLDAW
jgi:Domain of unknown function (DUF4177)